ncbi:GGDEF domain-containing protein [Microbacterium sp. AG790]|uniref:diguanylate cyclase n=1 Tax=Microbacterium sp. AG790 TaxID=2183995 RepID=UPI000EB3F0E7|nr:diguanylate cyclase [Microbacterium sp. AG790]RKS89396.1 GGDEF domain-containing protein [Microbacterium sp. AG790]
MNLDLFSVTVMTAIVASVASLTFILDTLLRRDTGPGRLWAVAFFCGLATTLAYMAWSAGVGGAVSVAAGNALFVSVPGFMLLGCRRFNDRSVLIPAVVVGLLAVVTFVAPLIEYPTRGSWGGWWAMAASLVLLFGSGAAESLRSPMRGLRSAWALSIVLAAAGLFYAVRLVVFAVLGPQSELFSRWLGSLSANIATVVLTMVAAIVMSVLRSQRTTRQRYEWLTSNGVAADGVMLPRTFSGALADIVERASWRQEGIAVIVLRADGLDQIGDAFGGDVVDTISAACRHAARSYAPAAALVGEDGDGQLVICTLAESTADARRVGSALFRGAIDELTAVVHGRLASVGVGVGLTSSLGYDAGILMSAARSAALRAARIAEASVFVAAPSIGVADADVASS